MAPCIRIKSSCPMRAIMKHYKQHCQRLKEPKRPSKTIFQGTCSHKISVKYYTIWEPSPEKLPRKMF